MADYYPGAPAKTALDSMPLTWGSGGLANAFGTVASATGTDPASGVNDGLVDSPESAFTPDMLIRAMEGALSNNLMSPLKVGPATIQPSAKAQAGVFTGKQVLYATLFVVIGLLLISRGFGLFGEEGSGIIVDMENPAKYPGIGHAIQHLKKGNK